MEIVVKRFACDGESTLSLVSVDGKFECFGLEDERREKKVFGETRIPPHIYKIGIYRMGRFHERYKARFISFHQGMLHIENVPNFTSILIHCGNTEKDTAGCLLVGKSASGVYGDFRLIRSAEAYADLYKKVIQSALIDNLFIHFADFH